MPEAIDSENIFSDVHALRTPFSISEGKVVVETIKKLKELIPNSGVSFTPIRTKPLMMRFNVRVLINDLSVVADSIQRIKALPLTLSYDDRNSPEGELGKAIQHFLQNVQPSVPCIEEVRLLVERENEYRFSFKLVSLEHMTQQPNTLL